MDVKVWRFWALKCFCSRHTSTQTKENFYLSRIKDSLFSLAFCPHALAFRHSPNPPIKGRNPKTCLLLILHSNITFTLYHPWLSWLSTLRGLAFSGGRVLGPAYFFSCTRLQSFQKTQVQVPGLLYPPSVTWPSSLLDIYTSILVARKRCT